MRLNDDEVVGNVNEIKCTSIPSFAGDIKGHFSTLFHHHVKLYPIAFPRNDHAGPFDLEALYSDWKFM